LKLTANQTNWDDDCSCYTRATDDRNKTIETIERRIENYLERIKVNKETFTLPGLEQALFVRVDASSFYSLIEAEINKRKASGGIGSALAFKDAYSAVKRFTGNRDFELSTLDTGWSEKFRTYMHGQGCGDNTVSIYLRSIQAIYNKSRGKGLVKEELNFKIPADVTNKIWVLSKKSMNEIINASIPKERKRKRHSLNYIAFAYYAAGMNFMDLADLRWNKNIEGDYIVYHRRKLRSNLKKRKMAVKITPPLKQILDYYKTDGGYHQNGYIFPIVLDLNLAEDKKHARIKNARKRTNQHFREIAEQVGAKDYDKVSFRVIRDTFASVLFNENSRPIEKVSQAMGHSRTGVTHRYVKRFAQDVIDEILQEDLY